MKLNTIKDNKSARPTKKILGRGIGSGLGKTSGRGGKGQTARSGVAINGFEGGQTPIYRRLPKRGFKNIFREEYFEIDFQKIQRLLDAKKIFLDQQIDRELLVALNVVPKSIQSISLIANGKAPKGLKLTVTRASKSAKEMLEKAGGSLIIE